MTRLVIMNVFLFLSEHEQQEMQMELAEKMQRLHKVCPSNECEGIMLRGKMLNDFIEYGIVTKSWMDDLYNDIDTIINKNESTNNAESINSMSEMTELTC